MNRPSVRRRHAGRNKTTIQILKNMQILNCQDLVSVIFKNCNPCQKALEATVNNFEGNIPKFNLQGTRDHYSVVYIDLLNDIKLLSYKNQKQTRYSSLVKYHILVSVDALTKFTTFALLSNKDQDSLATGLKIIAAQLGSPRIWMSDSCVVWNSCVYDRNDVGRQNNLYMGKIRK